MILFETTSKMSNITSIPDWLIYLSILLTLMLTIFHIIYLIQRIIKKTGFDFKLTKEIFFRILEEGESIYVNAVLVAYEDNVLIHKTKANLTKMDDPQKVFSLNILQYGEGFRNLNGIKQFYFYTTSPLEFIPESNVKRILYLCTQKSYESKVQKTFEKFKENLFKLQNKYQDITENEFKSKFELINSEIETLKSETVTELIQNIQIENGDYKLDIELEYIQNVKFFPLKRNKKIKSSIEFSIEDNAKEKINGQLNEYIKNKIINFLTNKPDDNLISPYYNPIKINEK